MIIKWLEIAATDSHRDKKYMDPLVAYTSNSYDFITRANAMSALRKLNYANEIACDNCINAALSSNGRLAGPASEIIKYFYAQAQFKKLISDKIKSFEGKNWEKEILNRLMQ